jgi:hypothetical protein
MLRNSERRESKNNLGLTSTPLLGPCPFLFLMEMGLQVIVRLLGGQQGSSER